MRNCNGGLELGQEVTHYRASLRSFLNRGYIDESMRVLVVCGGSTDCAVLRELGFTDCVISNLDERQTASQFLPFGWAFEDAEGLEYPDNSFDLVVVHEGLHHCRSPHTAILEMYRVATRAIAIIEPADTPLTRLTKKFGIGQNYEHAAVVSNDLKYGGVRNSAVANYVSRFTEREIENVVNSFAPHLRNIIISEYHLSIPWRQLRRRKNSLARLAVQCLYPLTLMLQRIAPRFFSNTIAVLVTKPEIPTGLQPWLRIEGGNTVPDECWYKVKFAPGDSIFDPNGVQ